RDHTERMFRALGIEVEEDGLTVRVHPGRPRPLGAYRVPGDISSAAFFLAGAALVPGSSVMVHDVGVNPSRTGVLDVLGEMGATVEIANQREAAGEPVADVTVSAPEKLEPVHIGGSLVPRLIDEIPVLGVLMTAAHGRSVVADAAELV